LENHGVEGFKLSSIEASVIDQEFADNTNLYLIGALEILNKAKATLDLFATALESKIYWYKLNAIWIDSSPIPFEWGEINYIGLHDRKHGAKLG